MQRLGAAQGEPGVEGAGNGTRRIEDELEAGGEIVVVEHRNAAHHVRVPVEVLGGGVKYDVRAELEGALEEGGGEGVVDDEQRAAAMGDVGGGAKVGDP